MMRIICRERIPVLPAVREVVDHGVSLVRRLHSRTFQFVGVTVCSIELIANTVVGWAKGTGSGFSNR